MGRGGEGRGSLDLRSDPTGPQKKARQPGLRPLPLGLGKPRKEDLWVENGQTRVLEKPVLGAKWSFGEQGRMTAGFRGDVSRSQAPGSTSLWRAPPSARWLAPVRPVSTVVQPAPQMAAPGPACVDSGVCPAPFLARGGAGWPATWHCLPVFLPSLGHSWLPPAEPRQLGSAPDCGSADGRGGRASGCD